MTASLSTLLVGFGGIAHGLATDKRMANWFPVATHAQAISQSDSFHLVGIVDPDPDARKVAEADWNVDAFNSIDAATSLAPDIIVFATPPGKRAAALAKFPDIKGVFVEKPLGGEDGRRLIETCNALDIPVQVNFWRRGDEMLQALSNGVLTDRIGVLQAGHALYGNGLANNGSHLIDMIRMLLGEPTWVQALGAVHPLAQSPIADDVHVGFVLGFESDASVSAHPVNFSQYREVSLDLWGSHGRLALMQETLDIRHYDKVANRGLDGAFEIASDAGTALPSTVASALPNLYENLAARINGEALLMSTGESALKTEAIIEQILRSADRRGERLEILADVS